MKTMEERLYDEINKNNSLSNVTFVACAESGAIPEQTALEHKELFDVWTYPVSYAVGKMLQYNDALYKVIQAHTSQSDWTPDIVPSLYSVINVAHAGTIDDPIPAVVNMEYVKGLYYIEDGVIYLMNREGMADGESITLAFLPSQLVGHYFEVVDVE